MGNSESSESTVPLDAPAPTFPYCCTFGYLYYFKVLLGDGQVRQVIQRVIDEEIGVEKVKNYGNVWLIELKDVCFGSEVSQSKEDALKTKRMAARMLQEMHGIGWLLLGATNLSRRDNVTSWYFRKVAVENPKPEMLVFGISSVCDIQVITEDTAAVALVRETLQTDVFCLSQEDSAGPNQVVFGLKGCPWDGEGEKKWAGRVAVMRCVEKLERYGHRYFGSCDLKGNTHTLFFARGSGFSPAPPHAEYLLLTLDKDDRLRMFNARPDVVGQIQAVVCGAWRQGIQKCEPYGESEATRGIELNLAGTPWDSSEHEQVEANKLLIALFDWMSTKGYNIFATLGLSRKLSDKSTFILRSIEGATPRLRHVGIAMARWDTMRLIGMDQELMSACRDAVLKNWPYGIQYQQASYDQTYEIILNEAPFDGLEGKLPTETRLMMAAVLAVIEQAGWYLISSADVSGTVQEKRYGKSTKYYSDGVDTWFLGRPV